MIYAVTDKHYPALIELWELSVRATHDFLPEHYLQEIKSLLPSIFPSVPIYIEQNHDGEITGFLGVADHKIEMLFIHPGRRGQGIGRRLTAYAVNDLKADKVDVNEQNEQAVGFYKKMGFVIIGRSDIDGMGRAFPLLHMELNKALAG